MTTSVAVQVLEWLIDVLGAASGLLLGSRRRSGWILSVAAEVVWLGVAWSTHQWAFVASSFVYGAVAVRGWMRWRFPAADVRAGSYCSMSGPFTAEFSDTDPDLCPACGNYIRDHRLFTYAAPARVVTR